MRLVNPPKKERNTLKANSISSHSLQKRQCRTFNLASDYQTGRKDEVFATISDEKKQVEEVEDDPYAESFVNQSLLSGKRQSYYPSFERHLDSGEPIRIEFEPTPSYLHEVYKFKMKYASTRDKVQSFNEATKFWDANKFLKNCHGKEQPNDQSRQGRKLELASYWRKMRRQHEKKT